MMCATRGWTDYRSHRLAIAQSVKPKYATHFSLLKYRMKTKRRTATP